VIRSSRFFALSLAAVLALTVIAACAGTHPKPVYGWDKKANFATMKAWAWYEDPSFKMPHGDSIIDGAFLDGHIRSAIDDALRHKGYEKVKPDLATMWVSYKTGDTGVGERDEYANIEWATGDVTATNWEKERTITIDIRDKDRKVVWRGSIDRLEGQNPDAVARELNHEVAVLMAHFPPST